MPDELLMEAVSRGDLKQASALFDRYHKKIFNFLARMAGDRMAGEDLTQNVFYRMLKYRNSYDASMKFQAWIYRIARNVFFDYYKEQTKTAAMDLSQVSDRLPADDEERYQEQEQRLYQSLAMLPAEQRELLVLTRFQQMKYGEVARIMDTTVANIKVKVHRAMNRLRMHYFELEKT